MGGRSPAVARVYRGRFAPSPTGPLHFGSLLAAMASFADARACGGAWLVRMEDLDRPREVAGAAERILDTLRAFGLEWDEPVIYQRERAPAYAAALQALDAQGLTYPCGCSRAEIVRLGRMGAEGPIYPGTCSQGLAPGMRARSIRVRTRAQPMHFTDRIQGEQTQSVEDSTGDFVLRRADGIHAYQLAVVVDDAWQEITHVVRGADLLGSTPRQILLQRALGLPEPSYAHIPLVLDDRGRKLSKSLASAPVDASDPLPAMHRAWACLGQPPVTGAGSPAAFWKRAIEEWRIERIPRRMSIGPQRLAPVDR
ncbi:tRNA glutamyl-Q(34) synthetase GluQRS [Thiocystis violacea]|uniref:tRNA glutamyl-Q(34) synthetase GluQRS n=1 Tax=Thiocystis violacea TaxID=13725 RepID=UPI001904E008|nr:tRNA glutamyl-Q(34) synthetase GluQRS [Thiocystis violacea]MBK1720777.1 tRNA glutamyl-Q(34) synthetase GluQRS [Thiocystis violacea]